LTGLGAPATIASAEVHDGGDDGRGRDGRVEAGRRAVRGRVRAQRRGGERVCCAGDAALRVAWQAYTAPADGSHAPTLVPLNPGPIGARYSPDGTRIGYTSITPQNHCTAVVATPNATDASSGVASQSCAAADTSASGVHTLSCTAADVAGNTTTLPVDYLVQYRLLGFFPPADKPTWKGGQTVPVRIALADANGTRISDAEANGLLAPVCHVMLQASGAQSAGGCMKYDAAGKQYVYTWKLSRTTGADTITATVSYPGTSTETTHAQQIMITS
jgi:hypothetical protein